jgi:hypothetical protein
MHLQLLTWIGNKHHERDAYSASPRKFAIFAVTHAAADGFHSRNGFEGVLRHPLEHVGLATPKEVSVLSTAS